MNKIYKDKRRVYESLSDFDIADYQDDENVIDSHTITNITLYPFDIYVKSYKNFTWENDRDTDCIKEKILQRFNFYNFNENDLTVYYNEDCDIYSQDNSYRHIYKIKIRNTDALKTFLHFMDDFCYYIANINKFESILAENSGYKNKSMEEYLKSSRGGTKDSEVDKFVEAVRAAGIEFNSESKLLYEKIIYNISKCIKKVLDENIQNFDVSDYSEDEKDIIGQQTINEFLYYPFTIFLRVKKCPFGIYGTWRSQIKNDFLRNYPFEADNITIDEYNEYEYPKRKEFSIEYVFKMTIDTKDDLICAIQFMVDEWKSIVGSHTAELNDILYSGYGYYETTIESYLRNTMIGVKDSQTDKFVEAVKGEHLTLNDFNKYKK